MSTVLASIYPFPHPTLPVSWLSFLLHQADNMQRMPSAFAFAVNCVRARRRQRERERGTDQGERRRRRTCSRIALQLLEQFWRGERGRGRLAGATLWTSFWFVCAVQLCCTLLHLNLCPTVIFGANYSPGTWQLCLLRSYNLQNLQTATTTTMGTTTTVTTLVESLTSVNFAISIFIFLSLVLFIWQISAKAKRPSELYNNKRAAHPPRGQEELDEEVGGGSWGKGNWGYATCGSCSRGGKQLEPNNFKWPQVCNYSAAHNNNNNQREQQQLQKQLQIKVKAISFSFLSSLCETSASDSWTHMPIRFQLKDLL